MLKRQGVTTEIRDPFIMALAEQLDLCANELDSRFCFEVGCGPCPLKNECYKLWNKEIAGLFLHPLRPDKFAKLSQRFLAIQSERNAMLQASKVVVIYSPNLARSKCYGT